MNRVATAMRECRDGGRTALVIYLTFGDPSTDESLDIIVAAAEAGADVIELGVPFSDPNADGPVIQQAMHRALAGGANLASALDAVASLRKRGCLVPVVLFGYYNPIFTLGLEAFAERAAAVGVDAVLVVDLPVDELDELHSVLVGRDVGVVPLIAPTSGEDRIAELARFEPAFVYYISMTGITGAALDKVRSGPERVDVVRRAANAPVAVGFGIKTAADAAQVGAYADGVIVGSAVVSRIADAATGEAAARVGAFVAELRAAIDS